MKLILASTIVGFSLLIASGHASDGNPLTIPQYTSTLAAYENQVKELTSAPQKAPAVRDSLPPSLTVETSRGKLVVSTAFISAALNRFLTVEPRARASIVWGLSERLQAMRLEAELYEQPSNADEATRKRLQAILASAEFSRVRGPSGLDLLRQRIGVWILKQLRKISPSVPDLENVGQILVWVLIGLAAAFAGVWLYRISRDMPAGKREILPFLPSSRTWQEWLAQAREAASGGRWREAIHWGFWAAVSRLESEGTWPPDKARTPREYLGSIPASSPAQQPFSLLTRQFETSWYGARAATETEFAQFSANLERLGCR
jgi:Domain of unknown function (DUF4129)